MTNDNANKPQTPKQVLLGELQSIKDLLNDENTLDDLDDQLLDIPILDDVVPELSNNSHISDLLDLNSIFNDDILIDNSQSPRSNSDKAPQKTDHLEPQPADADVVTNQGIKFPTFTLNTAPSSAPVATTAPLEEMQFEPKTTAYAAMSAPSANYVTDDKTTDDALSGCSDSEAEIGLPDIDLLVQELIDEMMPTIEGKLRARLSQSSQAAILALANKYLDQ